MPPGQGCQVITSDMCFNEGFGEFVEENGLATRSSAYHVVSIIGGQSSGKSTILNHLFGTSFDMMNSKAGRQQTTKGIWCACAQGGEMLVLDVEGTDGREKEDQKEFEGKSALFSLALTDVMMVNMWMHEVGRFNAANLPLIRTVLEVHLKPFRGRRTAWREKNVRRRFRLKQDHRAVDGSSRSREDAGLKALGFEGI